MSRLAAPDLVEAPSLSVAAREDWEKLSLNVTLESQRFDTRYRDPARRVTYGITRDLASSGQWKTAVEFGPVPDHIPAALHPKVPVRIEYHDDGTQVFLNAEGGTITDAYRRPSWPLMREVPGRKTLYGVPRAHPRATGASDARGARAWGDFVLVTPATKSRLALALSAKSKIAVGGSRVRMSETSGGETIEMIVDTARGRVEELRRTAADGSGSTTSNVYLQESDSVGFLSRSEHVNTDSKGTPVSRTVITYSNVKLFQQGKGGQP